MSKHEIKTLPEHVAIIMDGNGRWAELHGKPRDKGHRQGVKSVKNIVKACIKRKVRMLTLFAFSSENWKRPHTEVALLMNLFLSALDSELHELNAQEVKLRFIGNHDNIPEKVRHAMKNAEIHTAANNKLTLVVAVSYGGQWDIKQAVRQIATHIKTGRLQPDEIMEQHITEHLSTVGLTPPDLFIRTGGERRISNFLLWQIAYTELYFTDTLWPDFDDESFGLALEDYAKRQRRYGMTPEQISAKQALHA